jgi:hypothetical protein
MFLACGECGKYYQPKKSYQFGRCRKCQKYCDFLNRKECEKAESVEANRQQIKKVYWKKGNICLWCASVFSIKTRSSRNDGKYCSRQCRFDYLAWRTEVRRVQAEGDSWGDNITVPCLVCAKPFNTSGNRSRICSVGCKNKQAADRARAKYIPKEPGCCGDCGMPLERATMEYCPKCSRARLRQADQQQEPREDHKDQHGRDSQSLSRLQPRRMGVPTMPREDQEELEAERSPRGNARSHHPYIKGGRAFIQERPMRPQAMQRSKERQDRGATQAVRIGGQK